MKSAKNLLSSALICVSILVLSGCFGTVKPRIVKDSVASFDGNERNSGFIDFTHDGAGVITKNARDRYNLLIEQYGNRFTPPLKQDSGISPNGENYIIDAEHLVKFATMNRWKKSGQ